MKHFALLALLFCSCSDKPVMPPGIELMHMQDGYYLRTNGVAVMQVRYGSREEAIGRAYLMASQQEQSLNHIKIDAELSASFGTNTFDTNGQTHEVVHRLVWIAFNVGQVPFKGLLMDNVVSDQLVPTNNFSLLVK